MPNNITLLEAFDYVNQLLVVKLFQLAIVGSNLMLLHKLLDVRIGGPAGKVNLVTAQVLILVREAGHDFGE